MRVLPSCMFCNRPKTNAVSPSLTRWSGTYRNKMQKNTKNEQAASHYWKQLLAQFSTQGLNIKTHISIGDHAIVSLHDMVEEAKFDLVMLVAHCETGGRRWPYGSVTTSFIAYGTTSLLIMQDLPDSEMGPTLVKQVMRESKGH